MYKVVKRSCPIFGNGPYVCEFICDTASDISTLPTSTSEGTGGKKVHDNQKCASGSIATVAENSTVSKKYILNNQDIWCPYSVSEGSSIAITVDSSLSDVSKNPVENKVITAAINNKADISHTHSANEVGADAEGSAASALASSKEYTDSEIADLINGAPTTLDTLKEIADAMAENQTVVEALNTAIGSKADKTDIPTKMSELENDSGYLTEHQDLSSYAAKTDIPTKMSELENDSGYLTDQDLSDYALKSLYGDTTINVGRKANSTVGSYSTAEGSNTTASATCSHAEGYSTTASSIASHAEGSNYDKSGTVTLSDRTVTISDVNYTISGSTAYGINSHAEGAQSFAYGYSSHAEGRSTTASGYSSHAEGYCTTASIDYSHAEGYSTTASGNSSHAEGNGTTASNGMSHAEGFQTTASGIASHAEGLNTTASGYSSHAEGNDTTASNHYSHAEGQHTTASGANSHAEGSNVDRDNKVMSDRTVTISDVNYTISGSTAYGINSHAEGTQTFAYGYSSHAEVYQTTASGAFSHAEGNNTTTIGYSSHAEGYHTTATNHSSHAGGHYNAAMTNGGDSNNTKGTAFVIGNGTSSTALSNAFSVQFSGIVKAKSTITASTTADYAEFFEWFDENPDEEDRVGYFVTLDGDKIRIATAADDYILGVVSGEPFVLGNGDCDTWNGMFLRDEFRRTIYEPAPKMVEVLDSEGNPTGEFEEVEGEFEGTRPKLNPKYDHTQPYISRFDRKEWAPIGMLGVLAVRHDGTAQVNGYVTVNADGIATVCDKNAENSYRVIKANSDTVVEIIFR